MEVGCLSRILKRAKRWHLFADEIKPLPENRDIGRALTPTQKANLLKTASSKPEWQIAALAMTIALNTTIRACEIRGLQWRASPDVGTGSMFNHLAIAGTVCAVLCVPV